MNVPRHIAGKLDHRWLLAALLAVTVLTYHGVLRHAFVADDAHAVVGNPSIRSLRHVGDWLTSSRAVSGIPEEAAYRPVTVASLAVDFAVWNGRAAGFHGTNLLIHLGVTVLTFFLARRLWDDSLTGLLAAALVALHPVNAEAVNYVSARSSALAALCMLGAVLAHDKGRDNRLARLSGYGLCLLALGAKEIAVALPLLIIVWDRARSRGSEAWAATLARSLPFWAVTVAFLGLRAWILRDALPSPTPWPDMTLGMNLAIGLKIILVSLRAWLWPVGSSLDHAWPPIVSAAETTGLLVAAAGLVLTAWFIGRREPRVGWGVAWFVAALIPLWALPFVTRITLYQDHRLYLAGIGLAWIAAHVFAGLWRAHPKLRPLTLSALVVLITVSVVMNRARTAVWATDSTLWDNVLAQTPASALGHYARGMRQLNAGRVEEARASVERAVALDPYFPPLQEGLGRVYARLGQWDDAARVFSAVVHSDPQYYARVRLRLGEAYEALGRIESAREQYAQLAHSSSVEAPRAFGRLGRILENEGRLEEAATMYERGLRLDVRDRELAAAFANASLRLGRWEPARNVYSRLATRRPASAEAMLGLASALEGLGHRNEAADWYHAVLSADSATAIQRDTAREALSRLTDGPGPTRP